MKRQGFTIIELLVVLAIVAIMVALIVGGLGLVFHKDPVTGKKYFDLTNTKVYRCVKTYTVTSGDDDSTSTSKRVDLKEIQNGTEVGIVQTFSVDDNYWADVSNSATLFGQFESGKYYSVTTIGYRKEGYGGFFPLVQSVLETSDPVVKRIDNPFKAEVDPSDFDR